MKSLEELAAIRTRMEEQLHIRSGKATPLNTNSPKQILVCGGTGCTSSGSGLIISTLNDELAKHDLCNQVNVIQTGCHGLCALGPILVIYPEATFYCMIKPEDIPEIVEEHLINGNLVTRLLYQDTTTKETMNSFAETDFYKWQHRIALRNCGRINPENIEEYIGSHGYEALGRVLTSMSAQEVVQIVTDSGLRGRGGGGFPTGQKWKFSKMYDGEIKYVCCNADEGDPGAFMDRSVLEGDPHVVLEAMTIAGFVIGASQGYIYVRAEYPIAVNRLRIAIAQAREYGLLGKNIFGTDFSFDIDLRLGAGAFVCGEETALMTSIEGNRGEPRPRPPYPAEKGLFKRPTLLNNVETYANIPPIILNGADWFTQMGTEHAKGTKVFALGGKIRHTGLVEIPMSTTLRDIVEKIGGGIPNNKNFKAAQTGGPSGGCIPGEYLDIPMDYDNLISIGSMVGSGGLIIMDEDNCMVDIAKFFLEFTVSESCGKCTPCRIGTKRLYEILDKITKGNGTLEDLDKLEELCYYIKDNALCGLGQTAPNPVLSTLRYFKDEYLAHVVDKTCPAGVCKALLRYHIDPEKCKGCTICARNCPVNAIQGTVKQPHVINQDLCVKCGTCMDKCHFGAIARK